jgi:hypothetical protein
MGYDLEYLAAQLEIIEAVLDEAIEKAHDRPEAVELLKQAFANLRPAMIGMALDAGQRRQSRFLRLVVDKPD